MGAEEKEEGEEPQPQQQTTTATSWESQKPNPTAGQLCMVQVGVCLGDSGIAFHSVCVCVE